MFSESVPLVSPLSKTHTRPGHAGTADPSIKLSIPDPKKGFKIFFLKKWTEARKKSKTLYNHITANTSATWQLSRGSLKRGVLSCQCWSFVCSSTVFLWCWAVLVHVNEWEGLGKLRRWSGIDVYKYTVKHFAKDQPFSSMVFFSFFHTE